MNSPQKAGCKNGFYKNTENLLYTARGTHKSTEESSNCDQCKVGRKYIRSQKRKRAESKGVIGVTMVCQF